MSGHIDADLVKELSRDVIARTAPQELPLFRALSESFVRDGGQIRSADSGHDEPLGFGAETAVLLMTPIVLPVVSAVLESLANDVAVAVTVHTRGALSRALRLLLRREAESAPEETVPPLTADQLARIHQLAKEKARQLQLSADQAALLADALQGCLTADS